MRSEPKIEAKEQLREIVAELEAIRFRLLGIQASLPDELDPEVEIRAVIGCVLDDSIRPAIRDLRNVVTSSPSADEKEGQGRRPL